MSIHKLKAKKTKKKEAKKKRRPQWRRLPEGGLPFFKGSLPSHLCYSFVEEEEFIFTFFVQGAPYTFSLYSSPFLFNRFSVK